MFLSMIIARASDVAMLDRHGVLGPFGCGLAIEVVLKNGFDGAEGPRADLQCPGAGGLHARRAEGFDQSDNPQAGPEPLFRVRAFFQDQRA